MIKLDLSFLRVATLGAKATEGGHSWRWDTKNKDLTLCPKGVTERMSFFAEDDQTPQQATGGEE